MDELKDIEVSFGKIQKAARHLSRLLTFLFWGIVLVVVVVLLLMMGNGIIDYASKRLISAVSSCFKLALEATLVLFMIWVLKTFFEDISNGASPFTRLQAKRLRIAAVLLLIHALCVALTSPAFLEIIGFEHIAIGATIGSASMETAMRFIPINIGDIVLAVVLFCAALIVEYGSLLQRLSDDTV